jgi:hypothetical protein
MMGASSWQAGEGQAHAQGAGRGTRDAGRGRGTRLEVVDEDVVKERLVAILQRREELITRQVVGQSRVAPHHSLDLPLQHVLALRVDQRRHESADAQPLALLQRKARALVVERVVEHVHAASARAPTRQA